MSRIQRGAVWHVWGVTVGSAIKICGSVANERNGQFATNLSTIDEDLEAAFDEARGDQLPGQSRDGETMN